ncbi:MAG: sulfatase-like hydrolase/transferase [Litorilinea sp.]
MAERPHVLLITTDHWPASLLGCAGHPTVQTPTLDTLARSGVRYTNAYSECPVCIPARRTLMTGTPPRTHGDRTFQEQLPMPQLPTLAQVFRDAGYQAYAVGKLHCYPQRNRIGFDDVILDEEGRQMYGVVDDYEQFLGHAGHSGAHFGHGMSNNEYIMRPWHLPEACHPTNWATAEMARLIKRRDPTRPGFWFLSFRHPHPPLTPLQYYLDLYQQLGVAPAYIGEWAEDDASLPWVLRQGAGRDAQISSTQADLGRQAFYALCTHIDHQLRIIIGTLREEGLLNNTVICFTSDHGDMLGNHRQWAKRLFYEDSANVPVILLGTADDARIQPGAVDDRLVGWQDIMPTLLDLAGIDAPSTVEGLSMVGDTRREQIFGEFGEGALATRMIREARYKLIYYAAGNRRQLFDLEADPNELHDLANRAEHADVLQRLTESLLGELYGNDEDWLHDGELVGVSEPERTSGANRGLSGQRGLHWPPAPASFMGQM